jgi:hypothetical protein
MLKKSLDVHEILQVEQPAENRLIGNEHEQEEERADVVAWAAHLQEKPFGSDRQRRQREIREQARCQEARG